MSLDLCVIEGDGIGREVIPAAVEVLRRVAPDVVIKRGEAGWETFENHGTSLPETTIQLAHACSAVLFGAAASPSYPVEGYYSPIVHAAPFAASLCQHAPDTLSTRADGEIRRRSARHP